MPYIIAAIAIVWLLWPIVSGILRIIFVLTSGIFNAFGKFLFIILALVGIVAAFMLGPIGWGIGAIVFVLFFAVKR
ncbi:hypothetical protein [Paenibacillus sp. sgz500958]|uniref:hypothetical protein n=1 Tax=Paenibacillus sp. sgz500958 TaxID=3242475 RepID=UPI0036D21807